MPDNSHGQEHYLGAAVKATQFNVKTKELIGFLFNFQLIMGSQLLLSAWSAPGKEDHRVTHG